MKQTFRCVIKSYFFYLKVKAYGDTGPGRAVGNVSGYRCVSDCISRGREFDPGPDLYFMEIDHEIISMVTLLSSADAFKRYMHELLVNCLFKLAQEKVW